MTSGYGILYLQEKGGHKMKKVLMTIGRQYGSGGHEIGERVSKILRIPFFDRELIELASEKSGIEQGLLAIHDERTTPAVLLKTKSGGGTSGGEFIGEVLFAAQSRIILEEAQKGSCVIIGRCANYVLRDYPELISVYVTAPLELRIQRIMERNRMSREDAQTAVEKVDRQRQTYYEHYTGRQWGGGKDYRLTIDSSRLGVETTAERLAQLVQRFAETGEMEWKG